VPFDATFELMQIPCPSGTVVEFHRRRLSVIERIPPHLLHHLTAAESFGMHLSPAASHEHEYHCQWDSHPQMNLLDVFWYPFFEMVRIWLALATISRR